MLFKVFRFFLFYLKILWLILWSLKHVRFLNFVTGKSLIFKQGFSIWQVSRPPFNMVMLLFQSTRTKANAQASLTYITDNRTLCKTRCLLPRSGQWTGESTQGDHSRKGSCPCSQVYKRLTGRLFKRLI